MHVVKFLLIFAGFWLTTAAQSQEPIQVYAGITYGVQHLEDDKPAGRATLVIQTLLDATQQPYEILMMNWAQAQRQSQENANSLIYAIGRTAEREDKYRWLVPIAGLQLQIARLTSRPELNIVQFEQLKNYKVAAVRALSTHNMLEDAGFSESEQLLLVDSASRLLRMVTSQLVDFVFYEPSITPQILLHFGYQPDLLTVTEIQLPKSDPVLYLAANPKLQSHIRELIIQTHMELLQDEKYQASLKNVLPFSQAPGF